MVLHSDEFVSVRPVGEESVVYPPKGWRCRKQTRFVPILVDEAAPAPARAEVFENFPEEGGMTVVATAGVRGVGDCRCFMQGVYGEHWPTDPAKREDCLSGGYVPLPGDKP